MTPIGEAFLAGACVGALLVLLAFLLDGVDGCGCTGYDCDCS